MLSDEKLTELRSKYGLLPLIDLLHAVAEAALFEEVKKLLGAVKYITGIVERGEGRKMQDDESVEQFVLGYVKKLEALAADRSARAEPVAGMIILSDGDDHPQFYYTGKAVSLPVGNYKLYLDPPAAAAAEQREKVELTDDEIELILQEDRSHTYGFEYRFNELGFARAVIAAHEAKQSGGGMSSLITWPTCSLCGCVGIHACPGHQVAKWTDEEKLKLRDALKRLADREAHQEKGNEAE